MFKGRCDNCGNSITHKDGIQVGGNYWITTSGDWFCSNRCKDEFASRNSNSKNSESSAKKNSDNSSLGSKNDLTKSSYLEEQKRKLDLEETKVKAEIEAKERSERRQRANELRSQGKNFQAFLIEFQNGIIAVSVTLFLVLFFLLTTNNDESKRSEAMKINTELELIEDSVKIYINNQNYNRALVLTNKLVHNSHDDMQHLKFDAWNGYPKFDEYWTQKREKYKSIILNQDNSNKQETKSTNENDFGNTSSNEITTTESENNETEIDSSFTIEKVTE